MRLLSRGRLIAVAAGFASGIALAFAALGTREPRAEPDPDPTLSVVDGTGSHPAQDEALEVPVELAQDPEMGLAMEALHAGRPREALAHFKAIRERYPGYPEPLIGLSRIFLALGEIENAIAAAGKAAEIAPESSEALISLGKALEARGDRDGAEKVYLRAAEIAPFDPRPHFRLGQIAESRKHTEVAISRYRKALEANPAFAPAAHYLANQLRNSGNYDEAVRLLTAALARDPANTSLRLNLAQTCLKKGDFEGAAREFRKALENTSPADVPMVYYFLAKALERLGRDGEAMEALGSALQEDPHLHTAWYFLAQIHKRRGEDGEAEKALKEFEKARSLQDSIQKLKSHIDRHPRDLAALLELGKILLDRGKPEEALESLRKAIAIDPGNPQARQLLPRAEEGAKMRRSLRKS